MKERRSSYFRIYDYVYSTYKRLIAIELNFCKIFEKDFYKNKYQLTYNNKKCMPQNNKI